MLPFAAIGFAYRQQEAMAFLTTSLLLFLMGGLLVRVRTTKRELYARDGLAIVSLAWIALSFFGALPFTLSGAIPQLTDAFFETVSGFTTTGSSILREVESLPKTLMLWRSFTHWIGGMGVLLLTLAVLPMSGAGAVHILKAESPGPAPGKLVPRLAQTAKILYLIYLALTLAEVIALRLAGMPLFDTLIHAFGTAGTGGFSSRSASVGAFNSLAIDLIIAVFMALFGINFTLHYQLIKGDWRSVFQDEELRFYLLVLAGATVLIALNLGWRQIMGWPDSFRHAFFQVSSLMTTTGYATTNFDQWPTFSKSILVLLMFLGASAGSTAGGLKCVRILMVFKLIRRELIRLKHPRVVSGIRISGRLIDQQVLTGAMVFVLFYLFLLALAVVVVSWEAPDLVTAFTAALSCLSNIGPGLGAVGPAGHFADFSPFVKLVLSACMLLGRLELMPIVLLVQPSFWRRVSL